ncbi:MAG: hypothetical protein WA231_06580 [Methylocella sp.]
MREKECSPCAPLLVIAGMIALRRIEIEEDVVPALVLQPVANCDGGEIVMARMRNKYLRHAELCGRRLSMPRDKHRRAELAMNWAV